jgi:hypothetical protein
VKRVVSAGFNNCPAIGATTLAHGLTSLESIQGKITCTRPTLSGSETLWTTLTGKDFNAVLAPRKLGAVRF